MRRNELEHKLELFCLCVENDKQPPAELQRFIAAGVREFLADGKPWQLGKGGRPPKAATGAGRRQALQVAVLLDVGCTKQRAAAVMGLIPPDGKSYIHNVDRMLERVDGKKENPGGIRHTMHGLEYRWAVEALIADPETMRERIGKKYTDEIQRKLAALLESITPDEQEAIYDKN
jgi:hypothetical protein